MKTPGTMLAMVNALSAGMISDWSTHQRQMLAMAELREIEEKKQHKIDLIEYEKVKAKTSNLSASERRALVYRVNARNRKEPHS